MTTIPIQNRKQGYSKAILASPRDFHAYRISLPWMKPKLLLSAITFNLRTRHPGSPDQTAIDYISIADADIKPQKSDMHILAFAVDIQTLARYTSQNKPIIPGLAFLCSPLIRTCVGNKLGMLITDDWIEIAIFLNGKLQNASVLYPDEDSSWQTKLFDLCEYAKPEPLTADLVVLTEDADKIVDASNAITKIIGISPRRIESDRIVSTIDIEKSTLFGNDKYTGDIATKRTVAIIIAINLFAVAFSLDRIARREESMYSRQKQEYLEQKESVAEQERIIDQISALETTINERNESKRPSMYNVLSNIASSLGNAWIRSLVIRGNGFQIEAEGIDSIAAYKSISAMPGFSSVTLHQAIPSTNRGEIFSISGIINNGK